MVSLIMQSELASGSEITIQANWCGGDLLVTPLSSIPGDKLTFTPDECIFDKDAGSFRKISCDSQTGQLVISYSMDCTDAGTTSAVSLDKGQCYNSNILPYTPLEPVLSSSTCSWHAVSDGFKEAVAKSGVIDEAWVAACDAIIDQEDEASSSNCDCIKPFSEEEAWTIWNCVLNGGLNGVNWWRSCWAQDLLTFPPTMDPNSVVVDRIDALCSLNVIRAYMYDIMIDSSDNKWLMSCSTLRNTIENGGSTDDPDTLCPCLSPLTESQANEILNCQIPWLNMNGYDAWEYCVYVWRANTPSPAGGDRRRHMDVESESDNNYAGFLLEWDDSICQAVTKSISKESMDDQVIAGVTVAMGLLLVCVGVGAYLLFRTKRLQQITDIRSGHRLLEDDELMNHQGDVMSQQWGNVEEDNNSRVEYMPPDTGSKTAVSRD